MRGYPRVKARYNQRLQEELVRLLPFFSLGLATSAPISYLWVSEDGASSFEEQNPHFGRLSAVV